MTYLTLLYFLLYTFSARKSWFRECLGQHDSRVKDLKMASVISRYLPLFSHMRYLIASCHVVGFHQIQVLRTAVIINYLSNRSWRKERMEKPTHTTILFLTTKTTRDMPLLHPCNTLLKQQPMHITRTPTLNINSLPIMVRLSRIPPPHQMHPETRSKPLIKSSK